MTTLDPYLTLGLHPAADLPAIKAAYRRSVRIAHPDRGGNADDFIAVVKAFGVLSDPVAKRLFDETGQIDEAGARDYRQGVAILKQTGSYEQASHAIRDTPEMVAKHCGRFLPQDKAAIAAKVLNWVWEAA